MSIPCFCNRNVYSLLFFLSFIFNGYAQDFDNNGLSTDTPTKHLQENVSQNKGKIYITEGTTVYDFENKSSLEVAYTDTPNKEKKHKIEARIAKKGIIIKKHKVDAPIIVKQINYISSKNPKNQFVLLKSEIIAGLGGSKNSKKHYMIRNSYSHVFVFALKKCNYNILFPKNVLRKVYKFTESIRPPPYFLV